MGTEEFDPGIAVSTGEQSQPQEPPEDGLSDVLEFCAGEYGNGQQLSITRLAPHWCAGYLDTLPLDAPVSLAEIRDNWGGKRFQLRILDSKGRYIRAHNVRIDGPPRRNGRIVTPEMEAEFKQGNPEAIRYLERPPANEPNPTKELLEFFKAQTTAQQGLINELILRATQVPNNGGGGLGTIKEAQSLIAFARELNLGGEGGAPEEGNSRLLEKVLEAFLSRKEQAAAPAPRQLPPPQIGPQPNPRLNNITGQPRPVPSGPPPGYRPPGPPPPVAPAVVPAAVPGPVAVPAPVAVAPPPVAAPEPCPVAVAAPEPPSREQLAAYLASMPPEQAAGVVADVLDAWPPEKQKAAMDALLGPEEGEEEKELDTDFDSGAILKNGGGGGQAD